MSHTSYLLQATWTRGRIPSRRRRSRGPESTRSSITHVRKCGFKWTRSWHLIAPRGFIRRSRYSSRFSQIGRLAMDLPHDCRSGESRSPTYLKPHRTAGRSRGRTPRSRSDRTAIVDLLTWKQSHDLRARFQLKMASETSTIEARSPCDRGPIAAWSWPRSSAIVASFEAKLKLIHCEFEATTPLNWNRPHDAPIPPPRSHQSATIFGPIFLFKSMYFPSLFFNFWSICEGIKRISRKISSSSWSPRV